MPRYEYKIVPAPTKGRKGTGVRGASARFSYALEEVMNTLAGEGWEYQRAETLPSVERAGLTGTTTEWRHVLVFRRLRENDAAAFAPELLPAPPPPAHAEDEAPEKSAEATAQEPVKEAGKTEPETPANKPDQPWDNGVEDTNDVSRVGVPLELLAAARKSIKPDG